MFKWIATLLGLRPKTAGVTAAMEGRLVGKLESLLESTADAIVGVQSDGSIALVNPQTERLFGYLRDEVLGKPVEFLLPEIFQPGILGRRTLFLLDPETRPMGEGLELHGRRKDGSEFPADVGVSQFKHEELVAVFFIRDMTDMVKAEQALLESREEFREIVESAPDAMVIADSEGWIQLVNAETEELFGYTREELLGQAVEMLVPEDVRSTHRKHLAGYFANPRVRAAGQGLEPHGQRKDGSVFPVEIKLSPLHTKEGLLVSSVIRDVTERKRAERERERLFRNTGERVKELRCLYGVTESIRKRETLEQVCEDVLALIPPGWQYPEITRGRIRFDDQEFVSQLFEETEWRQSADIVIGGKPRGTVEVFYLEECPELDEGPFLKEERDLVDGIARTLSEAMEHEKARKEQERAVEALRESEERYRSLVENATYGIYQSTADGRFLSVNRALVEMLGYDSKEELLGVDIGRDLYRSPEERGRLLESLTGTDRLDGLEVDWGRKDGTPIRLRLGGRAHLAPDGTVDSFEVIAEDISARKVLEDQLRQAQKMEAVGELTGGIAHDFNNVLAVILMNAELISGALKQGESIDPSDVDAIRDAAKRASGITRKLLSFSRQAELKTAPTDLRRVVENMGSMLRTAVPESVELRVRTESEIPSVMADETAIEQTLLNLVTNARDAMPDGGVLTVTLKEVLLDEEYCAQRAGAQPGLHACLEVADTGTGMDAETQRRVFEPFFTTKDPGTGTGLGMAMVYGLTKQQGGYVGLYSEEGRGTTVRLYFPAYLDEVEETAMAASPEDLPGGSETLLVVEDQADLRDTAKRVLERKGYTVLTVSNGREALEVLEGSAEPVALVFSDLVMPVMGGVELYQVLRYQGYAGKFVLASGYAGSEVRGEIPKEIPFIEKPWLLSDLLRAVRDALDGEL